MHIYDNIAMNSSQNEKRLGQKYQRKSEHILCSIPPPPQNSAGYGIMWKNTVESSRPQMKIRRMRFACGITKTPPSLSLSLSLSEYVTRLFHGNNGYARAHQCHVTSTLPLSFKSGDITRSCVFQCLPTASNVAGTCNTVPY
jgi:hypothetical protein